MPHTGSRAVRSLPRAAECVCGPCTCSRSDATRLPGRARRRFPVPWLARRGAGCDPLGSMSVVRVLSSLPSWLLALLLGLGPLGADVLAALGHAELCACCTEEAEGCCGAEEESSAPALSPLEGGCPCAAVAPSGATPWTGLACRSDARAGARVELERLHRAAAFALAVPTWPALVCAAAPAGTSSASRPPGARHAGGAERVAALGVLRL
jgi:hypothetical protein